MPEPFAWPHFLQTVADFTGWEKDQIEKNTNLYSDMGLDSLGLFSLGMHLIKTYDIQIPLAAVASMETVNDIYALMEEHGKQRE
jgi:acyl carrier protein